MEALVKELQAKKGEAKGKVAKASTKRGKNVAQTATVTGRKNGAGNGGIPKASARGRNNGRVSLSKDAAKLLANGKLPAQAQTILYTLQELGGEASVGDLIDGLKPVGGLSTVQPPERIFTFYRKRLLEDGYIKLA